MQRAQIRTKFHAAKQDNFDEFCSVLNEVLVHSDMTVHVLDREILNVELTGF